MSFLGHEAGTRSFVIRNGRITRSQKKALEELSDLYLIKEDLASISESPFFKEGELVLDIGFGSGESLIHLATNFREKKFLGIEVYLSGIGGVLRDAKEKNLTNLKIVNGDAEDILINRLKGITFNSILFLFPDPWPKKRHHKRRLIKEEFVHRLKNITKPNGQIMFKSDWQDYFDSAKEIISKSNSWEEIDEHEYTEEFKKLPKTRFERKAIREGRKINNLVFRKLV
tara:strand:- start:8933 stop:9616 length:684 start_codon:yes stop_codon:yes gene_type:complete